MKDKKRRIGIDLDEVLADSIAQLIEYHNFMYGTSLKREDFTTLKFHKVWGGTGEEAIRKVNDFQKSPYLLRVLPVKDSIESVDELSRKNELFVITARHDYIKQETEDWLNKFFKDKFSEIYYSSNHYSKTSGVSKAGLCRDLGISVLIDDSIDYVMQSISAGIDAILFGDYGWNRDSHLPPEIRCKNWKEVLEKLS